MKTPIIIGGGAPIRISREVISESIKKVAENVAIHTGEAEKVLKGDGPVITYIPANREQRRWAKAHPNKRTK